MRRRTAAGRCRAKRRRIFLQFIDEFVDLVCEQKHHELHKDSRISGLFLFDPEAFQSLREFGAKQLFNSFGRVYRRLCISGILT